jgi:hypothetical protein
VRGFHFQDQLVSTVPLLWWDPCGIRGGKIFGANHIFGAIVKTPLKSYLGV